MSKIALLGATAVLSTMFVSPPLARAVTHKVGACPSLASSDGRAPAPSADWLPPGCETLTIPWSAPVGHRQPQTIDVPQTTSSREPVLDKENAKIDRVVKGVCRGC
jgi:hypothetical protein